MSKSLQIREPLRQTEPQPQAADSLCSNGRVSAPCKSGWHVELFADWDELRSFAEIARRSLSISDMNFDPEWLFVAQGWPAEEVFVLADWQAGELAGLMVLPVSNARLEYALGPKVLARLRVRQYKLYQGVVSRRADREAAVAACLEAAAAAMPGGAVIFAGAVPTASELHKLLCARRGPLRRSFFVLPWGKTTQHCRIRWEGSTEKYLASIGSGSRKELRRNAKALYSDPALKCELRRFRSAAEAEAFLAAATEISSKTYQRNLGLGITRGGTVERVIRFAGERGRFLGYILYINNRPAAFQSAFVYGKTCTMKQTGYDPVWAERNIGSVLLIELLRDIEKIKLPVDWLDFMPELNMFKLRTTNDRRPIRHFYLFKRTPIGALQYASLLATDWMSRSAGSLIKRLRRPSEVEQYLARLETLQP